MPTLLVTATTAEYESIIAPKSDYHLSKKQVLLTGFPRHDTLIRLPQSKNTVFIMPTWRKSLSGKVVQPGVRALKPGFETSEYVVRWSSLLNSDRLRDIAENHKLEIVFCPHPNFAGHLDAFQRPSHIKTLFADRIHSLQPHFATMAVMITDFSSVAFDAAVIDKPVVYYQFDKDTFFAGHIYRPGYFDYESDGFGPVVTEEELALESINKAVSNHEEPIYRHRRLKAFPFRDGKSSERLYNAIRNLN